MSRMKRAQKMVGSDWENIWGDKLHIIGIKILQPTDSEYSRAAFDVENRNKAILAFHVVDQDHDYYVKVPSSV